MAAARKMHSETLRTKHGAEDVLVAFVLDCSRCGRRGLVRTTIGHGFTEQQSHLATTEDGSARLVARSAGVAAM
jgi:hypothetical protein